MPGWGRAVRRAIAWLRGLFAEEEAPLSEVRRNFGLPVGRTVPAEFAKRPTSQTALCACGVLFQPRAETSLCLTCERGDDPALGKLIARRSPATATVTEFRKGRAR